MRRFLPILTFSGFVTSLSLATLPQLGSSQPSQSDSTASTETTKLAGEITDLNKLDKVSDQQVTKAIDDFFSLSKPRDATASAFSMISSLGLLDLTKKASPAAVANALRPYLKNPKTVWRAAEQAGASPEVAAALVPELMDALKDPNYAVRYFAACGLGAAGPKAKSAVPLLAHTLQADDNESVREFSAKALGLIGEASPEAIRALLQSVSKESTSSLYTDRALETLQFDPSSYLTELVACVDLILIPEPVQKQLNILGAKAVPAIIVLAGKKALEDRGNESEALISIGEPAEHDLIPLLKSHNPTERWLAVTSLSGIRNKKGDSAEWLIPFLQDEENDIRYAAIYGYAASSAPIDAKLEALKNGLDTDDDYDRRGVVMASGDLGPAARPLLPQLIAAMNISEDSKINFAKAILKVDSDETVARSVIQTLLRKNDQEALGHTITSLSYDLNIARLFVEDLKSIKQNSATSSENRATAESVLQEILHSPTKR